MSYILTVWLLTAGQLIQGSTVLPGDPGACRAKVAAVQAAMPGARVVRVSCVLEVTA